MVCPKCGNILSDEETSCKNCGARIKDNSTNSISTGGGKTELPSEEEKAAVLREMQTKEQQRIIMQQQAQNNAAQQEYMMLQEQLESSRKNNNMILAIVVVLIALVATFGGILLFKKINGNVSKSVKTVETDSKEDSNATINSPKEKNPSKKIESTSTDIEIGSYIFSFPANYETTLQDGMGISVDRGNQVQFVYTIMNSVSYESVLASQVDFKDYLNGVGFAVSNYQEVNSNNRKWLIYDGILNERAAMYAITGLGSSSTFQVTIFNLGSKKNAEVISDISNVVSGAKIKNSNSNGNGNSNQQPSGGYSSPQEEKPSTGGINNKPSSGSVTA